MLSHYLQTQFSLHLYATVAVSTAVGQKLYRPELIETEKIRTLLYDELPRMRFETAFKFTKRENLSIFLT